MYCFKYFPKKLPLKKKIKLINKTNMSWKRNYIRTHIIRYYLTCTYIVLLVFRGLVRVTYKLISILYPYIFMAVTIKRLTKSKHNTKLIF